MRQYFLSVCAAAILCYLWQTLAVNGSGKKRAWLIGSLILILAVLSPLIVLDGTDLLESFSAYETETDNLQTEAANQTRQTMEAIISEGCTEYILDQAEKLEDVSLQVSFTFTLKDGIPTPTGAQISGACTFGTQQILKKILEQDLGIPVERQVWNIS